MKWILKALVQKTISWLPQSQRLNFWFQKNVTKGVILSDQHFGDKLTHACDHLNYYHSHNGAKNYKALELGSGWYPVVPISLFLNGANEVYSIDISPLMTDEAVDTTIKKFIEWRKMGKLDQLEKFILPDRWEQLEKLSREDLVIEQYLSVLRLKLLIRDARDTGFADNTFGLVCSNNTYEHIYPEILEGIISEFQRVVKPGGVNSHFIDMSDHFAHLDHSITIYNFLKFSKTQWNLIDNSVQPQNRFRKKDYLKLYKQKGIVIAESHDRPGNIHEVKALKLHPDFRDHYTDAEIAISHTHLVSSKS